MKVVLMTGANGFLGRNLGLRLKQRPEISLVCIDKGDSAKVLRRGLDTADVIFHFAGVNRPKDVGEFEIENYKFTKDMLEYLIKIGRTPLIIFSSSTQSAQNSPYGMSKKRAEEELLGFKKATGATVIIFRLTNVFGKWAKPFYNSVVATFCYQATHGEKLRIEDPSKIIEFVYIDDVIEAFLGLLDGKTNSGEEFISLRQSYCCTLEELAAAIRGFGEFRNGANLPDLRTPFLKYLYSTYLSYLDASDLAYSMKKNEDTRGYLFEFMKSNLSGQVFVSRTVPGVTRGNHYHHTKVEKFCVIEGKARISLRHMLTDERIDFDVEGRECKVLVIPPGYTHSIANTGDIDLLTLFWANEPFDSTRPDTYPSQV